MLLVNQAQLPLNVADKSHPLKQFSNKYHEVLSGLKERFPKGTITLQRRGWPRINKETGLVEPCPQMAIPLQYNVEGDNGQAVWAYCDTRPVIHANGLMEIPDSHRHMLVGETLSIDLGKKPDLAVYLWLTPFVRQDFEVFDPEGDALRAALARQNEIELANAIWTGIASEPRLRMIAAAWGVRGASDGDVSVVRKRLEDRILQLEKDKQKNPDDVSLKGISAFLREIKADDDIRLRGLVQLAIDSGVLKLVRETGNMLLKGQKFVAVPFDYQAERQAEFITGYLSSYGNEEQLEKFLTNSLTADQLDEMDDKGLKWLSKMFGIDTKDKAPSLLKEEIKGKIGV